MNPLALLPYVQALIVLSLIMFVVGMIRPGWVFFWMKKPSRYIVVAVSMVLFMLSMIGYGETVTRIEAEKVLQNAQPSAAIDQSE